MKKNIVFIFIFNLSLVSCGKNSIPIVSSSGNRAIEQSQYEEYMVEKISDTKKHIKDSSTNPNSNTKELYLKHITLGFSLDFRAGLFGWNKGIRNSIELHIAPKEQN